MNKTQDFALRNLWYLVAPGKNVLSGRTLAKRLADEPILLGRTKMGEVFALRDVCPHRGVPLRYGHFDGQQIACCYHGWTFAPDGRCTDIPYLVDGDDVDVGKIRVRTYPCREVQGNIWVFLPSDKRRGDLEETDLPEVPRIPGFGDVAPQVGISLRFPCHVEHVAFGLMDPAHVAYVHRAWWWKRSRRALREKEKAFEPTPLGWRMVRHRLPSENLIYKLLGRNVTTEISFDIPGLRIEEIRGDAHRVVSVTALTPITATETEVQHFLYWTMPWLAPLKPVARRMAITFLTQDQRMAIRQSEGLAEDPPLMLVGDANVQSKWFARIKREWQRAEVEGRPFENPVHARTLRWRS